MKTEQAEVEKEVVVKVEVVKMRFDQKEVQEILLDYAHKNGVTIPNDANIEIFGLRDRDDSTPYVELVATEKVDED